MVKAGRKKVACRLWIALLPVELAVAVKQRYEIIQICENGLSDGDRIHNAGHKVERDRVGVTMRKIVALGSCVHNTSVSFPCLAQFERFLPG